MDRVVPAEIKRMHFEGRKGIKLPIRSFVILKATFRHRDFKNAGLSRLGMV